MSARGYTTWGSVRGCCGHSHRTVRAAWRCYERDASACARSGGYSDRGVVALESAADLRSYDVTRGPGRDLTDREYETLVGLEEGHPL